MYAIVEIAGHQYKVQKDQQIYVNRLEGEEGSAVSFDRILLTDDNGTIEVGAPVINGIQVDAKIVSHLKADKVIVFKKKRRKGYRVKNGHRQAISLIEITGIGNGSARKEKASPAKKAEPAKTEPAKAEKTADSKDDLTQLKGVGPKKAEALAAAGYTLKKIAKPDEAGMEKLANEVDGVSVEGIKNDHWVETAKELTK